MSKPITEMSDAEFASLVKKGFDASQHIKNIFVNREPFTMKCDVCNQEFEADLSLHGPGTSGFDLSCGHRVIFTDSETTYLKDGVVVRKIGKGNNA